MPTPLTRSYRHEGVDRQERIDILLDFAKSLPPLPERLVAHKDASHRVEECQSPVYLFVELDGGRVRSTPTPRSRPRRCAVCFAVARGLERATVEEILRVPADLVDRCGLGEILGMLRVRGLSGVLRRLKAEVTRVAMRKRSRRSVPSCEERTYSESREDANTFVKVASGGELPPGSKKLAEVDGRAIAVFNVDGSFYAIDDVCTHDGGPLAEGQLSGWRSCARVTGRGSTSGRARRSACPPSSRSPSISHEVLGEDVYVALSDD